MKSINLPDADVAGMRQFYQEELDKTLRRLQHIKSVLEQLGEGSIEINVSGTQNEAAKAPVPSEVKPKRKYRKKAGRKALWGPIILKRMAQINRPLTYDELTDEIMEFAKLPIEKRPNTKAAVVNVTFRLRTKEKKINTFSNGSREKYLALNAWFDDTGVIRQEFRNKLPKQAPKVEKPKGKRGRPAGSKNKNTAPVAAKPVSSPAASTKTGKRGRPAGSKNKTTASAKPKASIAPKAKPAKATPVKPATTASTAVSTKARKRGRPAGSSAAVKTKAGSSAAAQGKAAPKKPISKLVKSKKK